LLPKAIFFDYGDTLINIVSQDRKQGLTGVLRFAVDGIGAEKGSTERENTVLIDELAEFGRGLDFRFETLCARNNLEYRQIDFHRLLYGHFGISFSIGEDQLEWEYWKASMELELAPGVEAALKAVADRRIPMGIISNTSYREGILRRELDRRGIMHHFDFLIASADYGIRKPDPLLFEIALRRMGLKPEETWYIGNSSTVDCAGAAAAGMVPVWYAAGDVENGRYRTESEKIPEGTIILKDWRQLPELLERL